MKSDGMMSMKLPQTLKDHAAYLADQQEISLSRFVIALIEKEVKRVERRNLK